MRKCRVCDGTSFRDVLDMGDQPLVNSLVSKVDLERTEPVFPLKVEWCETCHLVQVVEPIDSKKIYRDVDYLYFSGDMPGLSDYFKEYADEVKTHIKPGGFVVEIGSNDGTMLKHFEGYRRLGVDPSTNVVARAVAEGIPSLSDFFSSRLARSIKREFGAADLIYANNCIAHIDNIKDVVSGVSQLISDDGVFVIECNYWGGMVKNLNYSLIYHDHFSYFTLNDWIGLAAGAGLTAYDAVVTPAQGGSLRVFMSAKKRDATTRFKNMYLEERVTGLGKYSSCEVFHDGVVEKAKKLGNKIRFLKKDGMVVAGYGAAAKGFSILSLAKITNEIAFFIDDSPAKQGKYTPVNHIPVIAKDGAPTPDAYIITAPNYAKAIMEKEKGFSGEWIIP